MEYNLAAFNGQCADPVSGHYHLGNGYRAYSPALGRFTAPDSWSPFGAGGINPYAYCAGDPVNQADPSGHMSLGQGIGIALGIVAGIGLSMLTEGLALGPIASLLVNMAGDALIGVGSELAANGIDGQRVNGGQVGIAAGTGTLMGLVFNGAGIIGSKLRGISNRPFGGLMLEEVESSSQGSDTSVYVTPVFQDPGSSTFYTLPEHYGAGGQASVVRSGNSDRLLKIYSEPVGKSVMKNEVSLFNKVYGKGVAQIKGDDRIEMPIIPGKPIGSGSGMTEVHARALMSSLDRLHRLNINYTDIHQGNILYDHISNQFNFIDFTDASLGITRNTIDSARSDVQSIIRAWPGYESTWNISWHSSPRISRRCWCNIL